MYKIIDCKTSEVVGSYSDRKRAYSRANKLDLAYGAVRYTVRFVA